LGGVWHALTVDVDAVIEVVLAVLVVVILVGLAGAGLSFVIVSTRWRRGASWGTVTLSGLRPGKTDNDGRQQLACTLRIATAGHPETEDVYVCFGVGPLDGPKLVDGATFPCRVNPDDLHQVHVYVHEQPNDGEPQGPRLEFFRHRPGTPI
jgi:hypothetical protein